MTTTKNTNAVKNVTTSNNVIELTAEQIAIATAKMLALKAKRELNPQFSQLVSKQQKADLLTFKSDGLKVLLNTKSIIKNLDLKDLNEFENFEFIQKCIQFINFITKENKQKEFVNDELLQNVIGNVNKTKNGLYNEYSFSQLVQSIVKKSIQKNNDYNTAINIIVAQKYKAKKEAKK